MKNLDRMTIHSLNRVDGRFYLSREFAGALDPGLRQALGSTSRTQDFLAQKKTKSWGLCNKKTTLMWPHVEVLTDNITSAAAFLT